MKKGMIGFIGGGLMALAAVAEPLADTNALVWTEGTALPMEGKAFADAPRPYSRIGKGHLERIDKVNKGVVWLADDSAGLSFRFSTDANELTLRWSLLRAELNSAGLSNIARSGIDIYERAPGGEWKFVNWRFIVPRNYPMQQTGNFYTIKWTPGNECWIYLPIYNGVTDFAVGIAKGKSIRPLAPRTSGIAKPVVFYGSSITQGADASRPGMAYSAVAGRRGDFPIVNLGFSGCAHMEDAVCDMVAAVDASCYVLDPLGNMGLGEIRQNYEKFVRKLVAARPGVPVVLASFCADHEWTAGREAEVKRIYAKLVKEGAAFAKALTFIPTSKLVPEELNEVTADGCHPTDLAMMQIGKTLAKRLPVIIRRAVEPPLNVGSDLQVLWDDFVVDAEKTTATRVLHHPRLAGPVLVHDKPWEGDGCDYHCIFRDGDKWRMYYNGFSVGLYRQDPYPFSADGVRICYAESKDGINWTRPELGLREFNGSKANNILIDRTDFPLGLDNFYVFKDPNPACPKAERYKGVGSFEMLLKDGEEPPPHTSVHTRNVVDIAGQDKNARQRFCRGLWVFTSPDGLRFKRGWSLTEKGAFDTLNIALWDPHTQQYFCYLRGYHNVKEERNGDLSVRDIRVMVSKDFKKWTDPKSMDFMGGEDYALYTNVVQPYPRNDKLFVGFPSRYVERKQWTKNYDRLPGLAARQKRFKPWGQPRFGLTTSDCVFMFSRDGWRFQRDDEAFMTPGPEGKRNWVYGDCYPATGFVQTPGFEGSADELSFYVYFGHWMGEAETLYRYTLRMDGFVSRQAPYAGAKVVTKPLVFKGKEMLVNFSTSARGRMFVVVRGEDGATLKSIELFGDQVDRVVDFEGDKDLSAFAGKPVRIAFQMSDADLYSFRFR